MDPALLVRRCLSSTWATSSITSPTSSRKRAATPSSSNGATITSPGALSKWLHPKNKLHQCPVPLLLYWPATLFSRHVHASVKLPSTSFLQRITIYSTCTKTCKDICLLFILTTEYLLCQSFVLTLPLHPHWEWRFLEWCWLNVFCSVHKVSSFRSVVL